MIADLVEAVRKKIELDYPSKDGNTLRDHLEYVADQYGQDDPLLEEPDIGDIGRHAFDIFWMLRRGESLSMADVDAYLRLTGDSLGPWELDALFLMDAAASEEIGRKIRERND